MHTKVQTKTKNTLHFYEIISTGTVKKFTIADRFNCVRVQLTSTGTFPFDFVPTIFFPRCAPPTRTDRLSVSVNKRLGRIYIRRRYSAENRYHFVQLVRITVDLHRPTASSACSTFRGSCRNCNTWGSRVCASPTPCYQLLPPLASIATALQLRELEIRQNLISWTYRTELLEVALDVLYGGRSRQPTYEYLFRPGYHLEHVKETLIRYTKTVQLS